jgi:probable phosphoglycerate mutase
LKLSNNRLIPDKLRNQFLVMRHGRSLANDQSLIISSPEAGIDRYGLVSTGIAEVEKSIRSHRDQLAGVTKIYASDFLRTRQTAEVVAEALGLEVAVVPELRERWFGDWEGTTNRNYETVWQADADDPAHCKWQVESVQQVAVRMIGLVNQLDQAAAGQTFLLVSHGDPLQILLTTAAAQDLATHRSLPPLETAEIRQVYLDPPIDLS